MPAWPALHHQQHSSVMLRVRYGLSLECKWYGLPVTWTPCWRSAQAHRVEPAELAPGISPPQQLKIDHHLLAPFTLALLYTTLPRHALVNLTPTSIRPLSCCIMNLLTLQRYALICWPCSGMHSPHSAMHCHTLAHPAMSCSKESPTAKMSRAGSCSTSAHAA